MSDASHVPVLLDRVLDLLAPALDVERPVVVDATLGLGGHTEAMLQRFEHLHVIGIDRDPEALARSRQRLAPFGDRVTFAHAVYDQIVDVVHEAGFSSVSGVLFDLGVSSMQLDLADRGFAYAQDAPLDMRMNNEDELTAADILNTYSSRDLARVLREYGEEKFAKRIADAVVAERAREPFTNSARLVDLIRDSIPQAARRTGGNPAKRTFQALRIEVNDELGVYRRALPASLEVLAPGGRVVVLSYHSLEDRITKRAFAEVTTTDVPRDMPFVPAGHEAKFRLVTRGAEMATESEIEENSRARSVRLRVVERNEA
ncbi:16S rRNA (cytosine(1402)-N(4))-methyltransferase RsmH [Aeromicrobium wangtongii]|uniref:Ribosomal RNA small subunit methyltransferase H n=1 Tax=Aeromicrobium wangtongii TaxID=2969247 RepID=A0ABY5MA79_9ACTN|nr:16S rRNA (cytosine(1402)-N(4))-methyltransferase RsmH [Aeromicrobium wangtongii]MCD9197542.1 16S rRNA (cytosine(1402)-N(4))-methyltransferase RsmH [Aeromicrobium wangtongii]UUP15034.1 16S rRNA (cytosine(1402)-N(4))-methyltransferase RsmH [Aeromicrobium wangtongii]